MNGTTNFSATGDAAGQQDYTAFIAQAMANAQPQQTQPQQVNDAQNQANPLFAAMQQQQQQQQQQAFLVAMLQQQQQQPMQTLPTGILPQPQVNMMMPQGQVPVSAPQGALLSQQQTTWAPQAASSQQQQQPVSDPQAAAVAPQRQPNSVDPGAYAVTAQPLLQYYGGMMGQMGMNVSNVQQPLMGMVPGNQQQQMVDPNTMLALQQLILAQQQQAGAALNPWMQAYQQQIMDYQNQQQRAGLLASSFDGPTGTAAFDVPAIKLKQAPRKKSKDKPKRPLSAYNFFFKEERARILEGIPSKKAKTDGDNDEEPDKKANSAEETDDDNTKVSVEVAAGDKGIKSRKRKKGPPHGKIGFESLAKTIGKRWKELGPEELEYYKEKADEDTLRYKNEMDKYMAKQREDSERRLESIKGAAGFSEAKESDDGGVNVFKDEDWEGVETE